MLSVEREEAKQEASEEVKISELSDGILKERVEIICNIIP
jgi:hypothetical protein